MRRALAALVLVSAAATPLAVHAQALPDMVRNAGVTIIQWQSVQAEVRRSAADKHVSERALAVVCAKMGVQLAKQHHFDINQMIALISGRADEINVIYRKLALEERQNNPAAANLLKQARGAIDLGDLDQAEAYLKQAGTAARSAVETAQRQEAEITATDAQVKALQFDYLGAAAEYAEAEGELPANAKGDRWIYVIDQAEMLEKRGELFDEPQPLQDAVALYRSSALSLVSRDAEAVNWARTQDDLGVALEVLGDRGDDQALKDSIAAEHAALEVWTRSAQPSDWAKAQNHLGTALTDLGTRGDNTALHEAVAAQQAALQVEARDRDPGDWAMTQRGLGDALMRLGEQGDDQALKDSISAFRAALGVFTSDHSPAPWAGTQMDLGTALERLSERGGQQALKDSISAYRAALTIYTRDRDPSDWAGAQMDLGYALTTLGNQGDDQALKEAAAAEHSALEVYTRERDSQGWAMAQNNLGEALRALGNRGDEQALKDSIPAYRSAQEVETRDRDPVDWATVEANIGDSLEALGEHGDEQALKDSIAAYHSSLEILTPAKFPEYAKIVSEHLARAETALSKRHPS